MGDQSLAVSFDQQELNPVITESLEVPRLYQTELLEEAKKRNIIIRADTGSGKTLVACELIVWMALQPKSNHQIQVFLVPTRPLVHQQAGFIQSRSHLRVKAFEFFKIDKLHSELNQVDVLVSTPKLFYDLISKGCWKFEDVSLLIFDEAHHCRKNHIYNQIMRSQYHRLAKDPKQRLPKILGMTASPICDFKNLDQAEKDIRTLQSALAAQLYEIKKQEDLSKYNFKPQESTVHYEPAPPFEPLTDPPWDRVNQLIDIYGNDRLTSQFKSVHSELGIYAYMLLISFWLKSLVTLDNPKKKTTSRLLDAGHQKEINEIIEKINLILTIEEIPENLLSSKMITLNKILIDYFDNDEPHEFQCIVFVDRRVHAQLLPTLLEYNARLKDFIRPVTLAGHGCNHNDFINFNMDSKAQKNTVQKLQIGETNLVVATSVAEEGLDLRSCKLVVRFNEITCWKGYIQSRGRARAQDSDYIVMLPTGAGPATSKYIGKEEELRTLVYDRPEGELIGDGVAESTPQLICKLPSGSHSILTLNASTGLLNDVCQLIPSDEFLLSPMPDYEFQCVEGIHTCQLTLPAMAALLPSQRTFTGEPMPTKKDAKRSAAFSACKVLRELGVLNEYFLPHREDKTSSAQDANGRKLECNDLPDPFESIVPNVYGDLSTCLEIWFHKLSFPDDSPSGSSTMGLLCAHRLRIPDGLQLFNHFDQSKPLAIKFDAIHQIEWDKDVKPDNLKKLEKYTRVVLQGAVNRKAYEGKLFFLVAPLLDSTCEIDWCLVEQPLIPLSSIDDFSKYPCILAPLRQLHSRIIDNYELCPDLSHTSPPNLVPICPKMREFLKKTKKFTTLGHFYTVVYDLKDSQYEGHPLVYLETAFVPTNNLSPSGSSSVAPSKILLPLINCKGTNIPRSYWKMYSYLPSLTRILYDGCQATALLEKLNVTGTQAPLAIKALTPPGVGVPWDYQTLETIGDAFLKLATSIHVYLVHLKKGEGDMSLLRARSVDNAYLRRKAVQANLPAYILSQRFRIDSFRDAQTEDGKALSSGNFSRKIPRRVLSDVVEALLGAGFLSGGVELGLKFGTALDLCFGGTTPWDQRELDLNFGNVTPESLPSSVQSKCDEIQSKINYVFKNKLLLVQALTHRSANLLITNCYEREEWLGDAVIDMWIIDHAYRRFINATAEELSVVRAKVVSNGSLGFLAIRKLGLEKIIIHNSEIFNDHCKEAIEAIEPFKTIGSFYSNIDNLFVVFDPPKILNDVFEAIIGALFVDSSFNLHVTFQTLDFIFQEVIPELSQLASRGPVSRLLEMRDKHQCTELERESSLEYTPNPKDENKPPISSRVCRIKLHGQEVAVGRHAESASIAEQRASLAALKVLTENSSSTTEEERANSIWLQCKCKSKGVALSQQGHQIIATANKTNLQLVSADDDSNKTDQLDHSKSLSGKQNKKKRARLAKSKALAEASLADSKPIKNDPVELEDELQEDDSIKEKSDESINSREDSSSTNRAESNSINDQKVDSIINQDDHAEDNSINNQKESSIINPEGGSTHAGKEDSIINLEDDSAHTVKDDSIIDPKDGSTKTVKDDSIINLENDSPNTVKENSIVNLENDSPNTVKENSIVNLENDSPNTVKDDSIINPENDSTRTKKDDSIIIPEDDSPDTVKDDSIIIPGDDSPNTVKDDSIIIPEDDSPDDSIIIPEDDSSKTVKEDSIIIPGDDSPKTVKEDSIIKPQDGSTHTGKDESIINLEDDSPNPLKEDAIINPEKDSTNIVKDDPIINPQDGSANNEKDDLADIIKDGCIHIAEENCVDAVEDDPVHVVEDDRVHVVEDSRVNLAQDNFIDISDDDSIQIKAVEFKKSGKKESQKNRKEELKKNKIIDEIIDEIKDNNKNELKRNREGASTINKDHSPKKNKCDTSRKNKESKLNKSKEAARNNRHVTSQVESFSQVDDVLIHETTPIYVGPSKRTDVWSSKRTDVGSSKRTDVGSSKRNDVGSSKRKSTVINIQSDDSVEIKAVVRTPGDDKKRSHERKTKVKVISIPDDPQPSPTASKRKRNKDELDQKSKSSHKQTCVCIIPETDDDEIIDLKPKLKQKNRVIDIENNYSLNQSSSNLASNKPLIESKNLKKSQENTPSSPFSLVVLSSPPPIKKTLKK